MNNPYSELAHRAMDKVKTSFPEDLHRLATLSQSDFSKLAPRGSNPADVCAPKKAVDEAAAKNLSQAQLYTNIKNLGTSVFTLGKKLLPSL